MSLMRTGARHGPTPAGYEKRKRHTLLAVGVLLFMCAFFAVALAAWALFLSELLKTAHQPVVSLST